MASLTAKQVIEALNLVPHPEKGYYTETFRDKETSTAGNGEEARANSTCIYYLLEGEAGVSHWHRVRDAVEIWHHYAGAPLRLSLSEDDGAAARDLVLGADLLAGQRPQVVVPRDTWQHAVSLGEWTLVGCTVAPGFSFGGFEMAVPGWEPRSGKSA
ncbi:RmlC-like cupin domain-containing protein [Xylaria intraflava]|nr:RmlC-like cupin domain-containing protein [Xylaria intraflava]